MINRRLGILMLASAAFISTASAQLSMRDSDQEARDAYQERCYVNAANNTSCMFPSLPAEKRLAMREISTYCYYNGHRVSGMLLQFRLSHQSSPEYVAIRGSLSSVPGGLHGQTNPIYAHTDVTPSLSVYLNPSTSGLTLCTVTIRGFLVDRK
jgi:hypothetical protein